MPLHTKICKNTPTPVSKFLQILLPCALENRGGADFANSAPPNPQSDSQL